MKKLLLLACTFGAFAAFAQKDVSVTMISPAEGSSIEPGVPFDVSFTVTNAGSTALTNTDSVYFAITVGGQNIFAPNIYWAETDNLDLAPGESYTYLLEDLAFEEIQGSGPQNMCAVLFLYEGTNPSPTTEPNMTNNQDCNSVTLVEGTVGIEEIAATTNSINVFPNPATDKVTFTTADASVSTAKIFTVAGALIAEISMNGGSADYTVAGMNPGMYIVNFANASGVVATQKFMVK